VGHKKERGPKTLVAPSTQKKPASLFDEDWREMRPAWRISLLEIYTPFGWIEIDELDAGLIRERLGSYESMKWKEIIFSYRSHFISRTDLCAEAQKHLEKIEQDDIDSVVSLGITQKGRVFGILEHNILKVLWWDPDHKICPSVKPNT
jgi:hypothetical protein